VEVQNLPVPLNNNKWALLVDRFLHCTYIDTGSTIYMEDSCRQQSSLHARRNSFSYMETCANSIQSCWSYIKRSWVNNLLTSTLWWKGPQWLTQESSSWPATEFNTLTEDSEIRNVQVAVHSPEDITQCFSKLNKHIRVIVYCRRFINNCRHSKANRHTATLTTQDLDQALTCCVKMVQQISYAQEIKDLMEQQEVATPSYLKKVQ
jgi:hypothetical protein